MNNKIEDKNERARAMLARLNEKELFRAAVKAGKLQFVVAPFVKKVENGAALTQNHYGAYGSMISKLSKGNRKLALVFSYALMMAGANGQGISDAMGAFFPE